MTKDTTKRQGYRIHAGPFKSERKAREKLKGVKGMAKKLQDGWYVLELCYLDTQNKPRESHELCELVFGDGWQKCVSRLGRKRLKERVDSGKVHIKQELKDTGLPEENNG